MKTLKKWIAFMLAAGLIVSAVNVTAVTVKAEDSSSGSDSSEEFPDGMIMESSGGWYIKINGKWVPYNPGSASGNSDAEAHAAAEAAAAAEAEKQAAIDEGFENVGDVYNAAGKNMSASEYYNNVVISTPGIENAVTVGQGGNIVVNGASTNMTAMISKVTRTYVDSVRANQPDGKLLNVVDISYPAAEASINFYMPSVTAEMDITALQYSEGTWVNVDVVEVREDHVVLNMKSSGVVAFIAK